MDINRQIQQILKDNNKTLTCAESCTGGLVSSKITSIDGSSAIFKGSIITYSNEIKEQELGVNKKTILKYGVVSCEVVKEMLKGVIKKFNSSYGIAISGITGVNGGTKDIPVGTVIIGVMDSKNDFEIDIYHFKGDRNMVQNLATNSAFDKILEFIKKTLDK